MSDGNFGGWRGRFLVAAIGGGIVDVNIIRGVAIAIKIRVIKITSTGMFLDELLDLMSMANLGLLDTFACGLLLLNELQVGKMD